MLRNSSIAVLSGSSRSHKISPISLSSKNPALCFPNRGNQNQVKALCSIAARQHFGAGIFRIDKRAACEKVVPFRRITAGRRIPPAYPCSSSPSFVHAQRRAPGVPVVRPVMAGAKKGSSLVCDPHLVRESPCRNHPAGRDRSMTNSGISSVGCPCALSACKLFSTGSPRCCRYFLQAPCIGVSLSSISSIFFMCPHPQY